MEHNEETQMRIEALEKIMHGRDVYEKGDIRTVADVVGAYFCRCGWAKDADGKMETGKRDTTTVTLAPDNAVHATVAGEANG